MVTCGMMLTYPPSNLGLVRDAVFDWFRRCKCGLRWSAPLDIGSTDSVRGLRRDPPQSKQFSG